LDVRTRVANNSDLTRTNLVILEDEPLLDLVGDLGLVVLDKTGERRLLIAVDTTLEDESKADQGISTA
jgi:hypothetical protein